MPAPREPLALVPRPLKLARRFGSFALGPGTAVRIAPGAEGAASLLRELLTPATGFPLPAAPDGEIILALDPALGGTGEEGYGLTVAPDAVLLRAARPAGLLHGVQTLRQLLPAEALLPGAVRAERWELPCVEITDRPLLPRRGFMIDVARHFQPVSWLRRLVDLLALHKLNVLQLHLTDDQGWRMPVPALPRLTEIGGVRAETLGDGVPHGGAYSTAELRGLVAYAEARGVEIVPEIEVPGHTRAAIAAYPHLGNDPARTLPVWTRWGVCDTVLGMGEESLDFVRTVLDEVMDVFPSRHVHVGGDECPSTEWHHSPSALNRVRTERLPGPDALRGWFLGQVGRHLAAHGRVPFGWSENGTDLPPGFTVLPWRDTDHGLAAARRGHRVITSAYRTSYLDYPQHPGPGEPPGQPGLLTLRQVYEADPVPPGWEPEAARQVVGRQAALWSEYAPTPAHLEYLAFPRLTALAERAWSPRRDWDDFGARLTRHRLRLDALGVRGADRFSDTPPTGEETG
ncbi:beta-N-acetylhexosaminidase [Streptomyces sp. SPB78]|uniref:beta-N-acetylhexosaminidase n=1 Tax=Streptomyces sp. (strain SPB78) TaxID=591157 RepID=UPI0001B5734D|nr:beta-N-acetylhexosaminidase [Streptomyces sp. SPB78]